MRKSSVFILGASLSFALSFCRFEVLKVAADEQYVYIGGMPAGFTLEAGGAQIIGFCEVISESGATSPALAAGLRVGDCIIKAEGISIKTIEELNEIINKRKGGAISLEIGRGKEILTVNVQPVKDRNTERYKIGVLVRDCVSGIGTVTYIDKNTRRFGALGHSVSRADKQEMTISSGVVYECNIVGVCKGVRGKAGELRGMFLNDKAFGKAEKLCECGIFGYISNSLNLNDLPSAVATSDSVIPGKAYIYSTVNGVCPKKYEIEIVKVDKHSKDNKNYVIRITDEDLISETGGIVQGMSGSPILQEGKLIGAVTHVFLNDPMRGYGIDIERMLEK